MTPTSTTAPGGSEASLEAVLERLLERARDLLASRYGALAVYHLDGKVRFFLTSGVDRQTAERIGHPPEGRGLLGLLLQRKESLRLAHLSQHPAAYGLPPHHPQIERLLAVPVVCTGPWHANLYVAERRDGAEYTAGDEETLARFATQVAIALDNTHLHQQVRRLAAAEETTRATEEMREELAQLLAYVNAKTQAVKEHLKRGGTDEAARQLDELAGAARDVFADVRETILGLPGNASNGGDLAKNLQQYLSRWEDQAGIAADLAVDGDAEVPPAVELQIMRIVQEALANARKHSLARQVRVALARRGGGLQLTVEDDGIGFDPHDLGSSSLPRFGLAAMRERATSLGGSLALQSAAGRGTRVVVELPSTALNGLFEEEPDAHPDRR